MLNNEEDDMEIMELRKQALRTLIDNKKSQNVESYPEQVARPQIPYHDQRPMAVQHHIAPQPYNPRFSTRPEYFHPQYRSFPPQRSFHPIHPQIPPIQPHVNPRFAPNNFNPVIQHPLNDNHMNLPIETPLFEPTPPHRLSPRSAKFVAENEEALRKSSQRNKSRSRSPPRFANNRSRSPHFKAQINHIARKRSRSNTPGYNNVKKIQNQRRRSPFRKNNNNGAQRNNFRDNRNNNNNNGGDRLRNNNKNSPVPSKSTADENASKVGAKSEEKMEIEQNVKKEKTEQEIEDELLASTDEEDNVKATIEDDDEDGLKVTLDDNDLDFLDDDDDESENEGRFKGKATPQNAKTVTKPSYSSRHTEKYDKRDNKNSRNFDYNRKRRSRSPMFSKKPEVKNDFKPKPSSSSSNNVPAKEVKETIKKSTPSSSTKPVESEAATEKPTRNDNRIRLVRTKVNNKVEIVTGYKKEEDKAASAIAGNSEKSIMKRLGGYVKGADDKRSHAKKQQWAQDQAT